MLYPHKKTKWVDSPKQPTAQNRRITQLITNLANEVNSELASLQKQLNRERYLNQRLQLTALHSFKYINLADFLFS